jgi:hypothetical protein
MTFIGAQLETRLRSGRLFRGADSSTTDGLSAPKFVKLNIQSTNSFLPAVWHDCGYRDTLEEFINEVWVHVTLSKQECDSGLLELCQDNFVPEDEAKLIYIAVNEFGQSSFDSDRGIKS